MTAEADGPADVEAAVADAHRREWGFVLAATVRVAGSVDLAEECVQDAYGAALDTWRRQGVPRSPGAWLTTTARRRALDVLRREQTLRRKLPLLAEPGVTPGADEAMVDQEDEVITDERLRLVFTCCHPALAREAQVALTLRLLCGLTTAEIAAAFLVPEPTMAARVTRAKKKIAAAHIPYRVPGTDRAPGPARRGAHRAAPGVHDRAHGAGRCRPGARRPGGPRPRPGPGAARADARRAGGPRAARADAAHRRAPGHPGRRGRPAACCSPTRTGTAGTGRRCSRGSPWSATCTTAGSAGSACRRRSPRSTRSPRRTPETRWGRVVALYDALLREWPSPVVELNRAVALAEVAGPEAALAEVDRLAADGRLAGYRYLPATRADLLRRLGRSAEAATAYDEALTLTDNEAERAFLTGRRDDARRL